jgi:hypothetical protein
VSLGRGNPRRVLALGAVVAIAGLVLGGRPSITLYDGVVPAEPYRWLQPPPGAAGDPPPVTSTIPVSGGSSPLLAVATPELVPQAQVFAIPGGLKLPAGSTRIDVSIRAVPPPDIAPADAHVAGNVYEIKVVNQAGVAATADPQAEVSVVLRAPDPLTATASLARWDGSTWQVMPSVAAGVGATFGAVVTQFGDFAIVLPGAEATLGTGSPLATGEPAGEGPSPGVSATESLAVALPTDAAAPPPTGLDRGTLTVVLGGLAAVIVALVAVMALMPSRGGRSSGSGRRRR